MVLFRANSVDTDSRAKKLGMTLTRLGYDVHLLSAEPDRSTAGVRHLLAVTADGPAGVTIHPVPIGTTHRDLLRHKIAHRRRRQFRFLYWGSKDEYVTRVREARGVLRRTSRRDPRRLVVLAALLARSARWRAQWAVNVSHRLAWRHWDEARANSTRLATTHGVLPELEDYADAFAPVLDRLAPDVIHAHHPLVLGIAVRAARRLRAQGRDTRVIYDAREDFAGLPVQEQGRRRRHAALVREEARHIGEVDAVVTVSEPIARTLAERYRLPALPTVVLNAPVDDPARHPGGAAVAATPTVRQVIGLPDAVPLLVYSGAVSRARGVDVLIRALAHLPGVHAVVVPVPHPHPHLPALHELAAGLGVGGRFHVAPPVDQDHLLHYLSGADLAVFPIRTGSPNIEQALPNKLFESVHAHLPIVTCDARLIADFVTEHDLGEVFSFGTAGGSSPVGPGKSPEAESAPDRDEAAAADLARAVRRGLEHPRDPSGAHWQQVRRHYSWQGQEGAIRQVYGSLSVPPTPDGIEVEPFGSLMLHPGEGPARLTSITALDGRSS